MMRAQLCAVILLTFTPVGVFAVGNGKREIPAAPSQNHQLSSISDTIPRILTAAEQGDFDLVKELIAEENDVNIKGYNNVTAFMYAAGRGHVGIMTALRDAGADLNACSLPGLGSDGETALTEAIKMKQTATVEVLVSLGVSLEQSNNAGETPLLCAVKSGYVPTAEILVKARAKISYQVLLHAFKNGNPFMIKELVIAEANINMSNAQGESVLMTLIRDRGLSASEQLAAVQLLLSYNPDINIKNHSGESALSLAMENSSVDVVRALVVAGASVNLREKYWIDLKKKNKVTYQEIVHLLPAQKGCTIS